MAAEANIISKEEIKKGQELAEAAETTKSGTVTMRRITGKHPKVYNRKNRKVKNKLQKKSRKNNK